MPIAFIMPKFDMDQEKATVVAWLKQEGDQIEYDDPVLTVETDKVAIDVPAPASGILAQISAKPGDVVPVTTVIAYILKPGESLSDLPAQGQTPAASAEVSPAVEAEPVIPARMVIKKPDERGIKATPVAERMAQSLGIDLAEVPGQPERITKAHIEQYLQGGKVPATPAARRLAGELNIDLARVPASGPQGRVQAQDVEQYSLQAAVQPAIPVAPVPVQRADQMIGQRPAELVPLTGIRSTIADRMQASFQTAPHIALTVEVDLSQLESTRARLNEYAAHLGKSKVSVTALLVRLTAWALQRHPFLNASLVDQTIYMWQEINIGVATAIQGGLIVPVIRNASHKTVAEINDQIKDLSERARANKLTLEEVKEGTFTISNLGMFGIQQFRAIINPPESAILAVGSVVRKPVVIDDQDTVAVRPRMALTLSADHRVVDGVAAAEFLNDLVQAIEHPDILIY